MTADVSEETAQHLLRSDGQEDLCLVRYSSSTGASRDSALMTQAALPRSGDREVHGNVTFTGSYVFRIAAEAAREGQGVAIAHSHPLGQGWQGMSRADSDAERSYAHLAERVTGLPLVGLTLAGDRIWSARRWPGSEFQDAENVRVLGSKLKVSWNDLQRPVPRIQNSQLRTVSAWGDVIQADLARLKVLVVGVGTSGMDIAVRLAATGVEHIGVLDFDHVEDLNRDRLVWATAEDAAGEVPKVDVAERSMLAAGTAENLKISPHNTSICLPDGLAHALDYDVIFSCVDHPWPRAVLNQIAYTDLIPVIDGGIAIDTFDDGTMRNATWRSHVLRPGRPCLQCNKQIAPAEVSRDMQGLLDDPKYLEQAGLTQPAKQNVALLATSVAAAQLAQFVSLVVAPGDRGEPGPLQFSFSSHTLQRRPDQSSPHCFYENSIAVGDRRVMLVGVSRDSTEGEETA